MCRACGMFLFFLESDYDLIQCKYFDNHHNVLPVKYLKLNEP